VEELRSGGLYASTVEASDAPQANAGNAAAKKNGGPFKGPPPYLAHHLFDSLRQMKTAPNAVSRDRRALLINALALPNSS
jgi:hypothetical protein